MKNDEAKLFVTLTMALVIYALCQQDVILAVGAFGILFVPFILRMLGPSNELKWLEMPWLLAIFWAALAGWIWRALVPASSSTVSFLPRTTGILQAGVIIFTLLVWLRPYFRDRVYFLRLLSWSIVALSINIPFSGPVTVIFWIFCAVSTLFILMEALKTSPQEKQSQKYKRGFSFYGIVFLFLVVIYGNCRAVIWTIEVADQTFLHLVDDYSLALTPSHFLNMKPFLQLDGPGISGRDIRPVLEIDSGNNEAIYLITQVFEGYENGIWKVATDPGKHPLSKNSAPDAVKVELKMFDQFTDIIPAPKGVVAANGKGEFLQDKNGIVYNTVTAKARKVWLNLTPGASAGDTQSSFSNNLLEVSPPLKQFLTDYFLKNLGPSTSDQDTAEKIEDFFKSNFRYNLDVTFRADDRGLIKMLKERKSAYCSYFASAMALMLRAQGIPARMVTGFLATETIGQGKDKFLVRVRDAHAWVEALLPSGNGNTRQWVRFDPTPGVLQSASSQAKKIFIYLADLIWRWKSEWQVELSAVEWKKVRQQSLVVLFILGGIIYLRKFWLKRIPKKRKFVSGALTGNADKHLQDIYKQFALLLQSRLGCQKEISETHTELLERLKQKHQLTPDQSVKMSRFLSRYEAARFGSKNCADLESLLNNVGQGLLKDKA